MTGDGSRRQQNDLQVVNGVISGTLEKYGIKSPFATSGIGFAARTWKPGDRGCCELRLSPRPDGA